MATWGGIRAWTNESYANVSDMERVFGNLEFLMERTKSVTVSAPDKARAVELKSVAINDIIYKEDFDWFYDQMQTFCAAYEAAGGGFQYEPIITEEQWDRCREIREQKKRHCTYFTQNGEVRKESGVYSSKDIWSRKLKCRCGYRMRRNKWHKNKSGEVIYGYKCYNQLNNGSKAIRDSVGVESEKACDLREICDWKFEMMARHIFSGLWGNKKDILNEVSSLYRVNSRENKMETDREKSELDKEIAKIDAKMKRLTQMRLDDELPKNEYLEFKSDLESKRNALVLKRSKLNSKTETDPDGLTERIQEFLLAKMNFTEHCIDRDVISQFVTTIIPRTETCFEWYLNFDLIDKPNEEKKMVWEFPIEFQEAKSYRTEVNSLLRPTQWQDLLVRVYV